MINKRKIGKTDIKVSELGFGCAPLGGWPLSVSDQDANISLETDDIVDFSSFTKGIEILKKYKVQV